MILFRASCALVVGAVFSAFAQDPVAQGFDHFYNLEYDEAIANFEKAAQADPANPEPHNHLSQAILYREMFRNGALESELVSGTNSFLRRPKLNPTPAIEKRFDTENQRAMELAQGRIDKNPKDTGAMHALAVALGLRANYNFLVKKAWRQALNDFTAARKLDNEVTALDPTNYDARLTQAVHDYVVGSLPWTWRALGSLVGFRGDKEEGLRMLEEVSRKGRVNKVDAQILLCALYRREKEPQKALPLLADLVRRYPRDYLLRFEQAQMYGAIGKKKEAMEALNRIEQLKVSGSPGYARVAWEKIYYERANLLFWYDDYDKALENLMKVTRAGKNLDLNTGVLAYMRLGQIYDMKHEHDRAVEAYEQAIAFAPEAEAAKESQRYIASPYRRERDRS